MRMRKKPNLIPRMERCAETQVKNPEEYKGKWLKNTGSYSQAFLELGCGKGKFTIATAKNIPDTLLIAVERVPDAMVIGMERAVAEEVKNVRFVDCDAARLPEIFEKGEVGRIYINFCDPWPGKKRAKRRLTSVNFLNVYKQILMPGSEIHFKTDNDDLFEYSLEQFKENGFQISEVTNDLHRDGPNGVMTDYETKFYEQGVKINRCVATLL